MQYIQKKVSRGTKAILDTSFPFRGYYVLVSVLLAALGGAARIKGEAFQGTDACREFYLYISKYSNGGSSARKQYFPSPN
jgi:hypothetical protein